MLRNVGRPGGAGLVAERRHGDEARGLGLAEHRPEARVRAGTLEAGDGLGAVEAGHRAQAGKIAGPTLGLVEQRAQDRRKLRQHRHLLAADEAERGVGLELRRHDGGAAGVLCGEQQRQPGDMEQRQHAEMDVVGGQRPVVQEVHVPYHQCRLREQGAARPTADGRRVDHHEPGVGLAVRAQAARRSPPAARRRARRVRRCRRCRTSARHRQGPAACPPEGAAGRHRR